MGNPRSLLRKMNGVNVDKICIDSISETKEAFISENQQQMFAGLKSDGSTIEPPYAASTIRRKQKRGQPTDRVTFKGDTGNFYAGFTVDVGADVIKESSTVDYTKYLVEGTDNRAGAGSNIFGLGGVYKSDYLKDNLRPAFNQKIEAATGLKF